TDKPAQLLFSFNDNKEFNDVTVRFPQLRGQDFYTNKILYDEYRALFVAKYGSPTEKAYRSLGPDIKSEWKDLQTGTNPPGKVELRIVIYGVIVHSEVDIRPTGPGPWVQIDYSVDEAWLRLRGFDGDI
ncbi:MAG: hypothetical protein QMD11_11980, partial [Smithella sp.]|nr:hypothetical protein [Smithella sp.]